MTTHARGRPPGNPRNSPPALERGLRLCTVVGLAAVMLDAVLFGTGIIDWQIAVVLLLVLEIPMGTLALALHLVTYRWARGRGANRNDAWEVLLAANPPLRLVQVEVATLVGLPRDIVTLVRGRHRGPDAFGYSAGTRTVPVALAVVLVLETIGFHLIIPWAWLRLVLLVINAYAVLLVTAGLVARTAHPHRVLAREDGDRVLHLMAGRHVVLKVLSSDLTRVTLDIDRTHTWLAIEHGLEQGGAATTTYLATQFGTNVRLTPSTPLPVRLPRIWGPDSRVEAHQIRVMVDEPKSFRAALDQTNPAQKERPRP